MAVFLDAIRRLYDYQREMNDRILLVAERLSETEFVSVIVDGQPSIRDTLVHLFDVIDVHFAWFDYSRDRVAPAATEISADDYTNVGAVRDLEMAVNSMVQSCIGSLESDSDLGRTYERAFPDGHSNQRALWEMLLHVANHGTQHRSEVAVMLTKLGHSPGDMEIL